MLKRIAGIVFSAGMMVPILVSAEDKPVSPAPTNQGKTGVQAQEPNPTNARAKADADARKMSDDKSFVMEAASGGMLEVQLGQLIQQRGSNDQAKNVGRMMVEDHTKANERLMAIAGQKNIMVPKELSDKDRMTLEKMQKLSGAELDRAYLMDMVEDHKHDIAAFQNEAKNGQDADVKMFADTTLPTLKTHLDHVQKACTAMGIAITDDAQPAGQKITPDKTPDAGKAAPSNQGNHGNAGNLAPVSPNK